MTNEFKNIRRGVLRRGQFVTPFGVGSIVNLPDESLMPAVIDLWGKNVGLKIYDDRLQKRLGVDYFKMVPSSEEYKDGVPFFRFPKWLFCPRCRSFRPVKEWQELYKKAMRGKSSKVPRCDKCRIKLVPSRFVVACEKGHIDDFPWVYWIHKDEPCTKPELKITTGGGTSGLVGITVKCQTCGKHRTMAGAFDQDAHKNFNCTGFKPWANNRVACELMPRTLQRGASNVYFPKAVSSIVIPPYSDDIISEIERSDGFNFLKDQDGILDANDAFFRQACNMIAKSINRTPEEVIPVITTLLNMNDGGEQSQKENDYRHDEYNAFLGHVDQGSLSSKDFHIEIREGSDYNVPGLDKLVLVHRLREVRCLVAFSRIKPLERNEFDFGELDHQTHATAVSVREDRSINWLPAFEVRGEGIFLSFKNDDLMMWESEFEEVRARAETLNKRYNELALELKREERSITPRFVFLHTLAHLMIRQLSFECGYGSSSLRERIYCSEEEGSEMAGILIYTASGDSEGTLGGLVRQGKPQFFNGIVEKAVRNAAWCSTDPLCVESSGQGMNSLNLAACHACTLLPETSCEELNRLLDRVLVVGVPSNTQIGFMGSMI